MPPQPETAAAAAAITARLDRLPPARPVWWLVFLLSLGAFFEMYDLFLTAYISPGLLQSGVFSAKAQGWFGLSDQAAFAAATFAGLFVGTIAFSAVADRFGRRPIFTFSLLWYTAATVAMACQNSARGVDLFRFIAGVGIGVELVTIDAYISELVPKAMRARAFAFNAAVQFLAIPTVALLCWILLPRHPLGLAGWRWVLLIGATSAVAVWFLRARLPESPRWLAQHGRIAEAERVTAGLEQRVAATLPHPLPPPALPIMETAGGASFADLWRPPYRRRVLMLAIFNVFQAIGFYGFGNWVPAFLAAQGASVLHSLQYSFIIAIAYPVGPLLGLLIADRFEIKWQVVGAAFGIAAFGLLFSRQQGAAGLIACGILVTLCYCLMSYSFHAYQTELFPTRVRARAVGFCYSWSRLSTVFSSFVIAFCLQQFGTGGVFAFIAASMLAVMVSIGVFGPRTHGLALEEISH